MFLPGHLRTSLDLARSDCRREKNCCQWDHKKNIFFKSRTWDICLTPPPAERKTAYKMSTSQKKKIHSRRAQAWTIKDPARVSPTRCGGWQTWGWEMPRCQAGTQTSSSIHTLCYECPHHKSSSNYEPCSCSKCINTAVSGLNKWMINLELVSD